MALSQGLAALTDDDLSLSSDYIVSNSLKKVHHQQCKPTLYLEVIMKSYALHSAPQDNQDT